MFSPQYYEPKFKQQIVRLHIEEGRIYRSLTDEYGISKASICKWRKEFSEECQQNTLKSPTAQNDLELMKENRRLREELAEERKENLFLKKQRHSSQRESTRGLSVHRQAQQAVWCSVAAATVEHLSERLLQLSKTSVGTEEGEKAEDSRSDSDDLP